MTYELPIRKGTNTIIMKFAEVNIFFNKDVLSKARPKSL